MYANAEVFIDPLYFLFFIFIYLFFFALSFLSQ